MEMILLGYEEAMKKLSSESMQGICEQALKRFAEEVKLRAIPYPPEGPWNRPGPYPHRWYQRQFGPRWMNKDGSYGGRNTSERMQKSWVTEMRAWNEAVVGNMASYADYVQGGQQRDFHQEHGWKKVEDIAAEQSDLWTKIFSEELERAIGGAV